MFRRVRALAVLLTLALVPASVGAEVVRTQVMKRGKAVRDLTVILPRGYSRDRKYPVLYLLDGQNLIDHPWYPGGWRAEQGLHHAIDGGMQPVIIVGVHAGDREHDFTPHRDADEGGGGAKHFLDHLERDVVPYVEQHFSVREDRDGRAIGGASYGANAALHAMLTRGKTFGRGLIMSPALWHADYAAYADVKKARSLGGQHIVLYNGGDEDGREETEHLRDLIAKKGGKFDRNFFHWTEHGAHHDEPAWAHFLSHGLTKLFR